MIRYKDGVREVLINDSCYLQIIPPFYSSFLFPETPDFSILTEVLLEAFSLALVSASLLVFLGKKIASFHNYEVNSNQVRGQAFLLLSLTL